MNVHHQQFGVLRFPMFCWTVHSKQFHRRYPHPCVTYLEMVCCMSRIAVLHIVHCCVTYPPLLCYISSLLCYTSRIGVLHISHCCATHPPHITFKRLKIYYVSLHVCLSCSTQTKLPYRHTNTRHKKTNKFLTSQHSKFVTLIC